MKIRLSFVSNSSSSSFIVGFAKIPTTVAEMKEMLFADGRQYVSAGDSCLSANKVSEIAFQSLQNINPILSFDEMYEEVNTGWYEGAPEAVDFSQYKKVFELEKQFKLEHGEKENWIDYPEWKKVINEAREKSFQKRKEADKLKSKELWDKMSGLNIYCFVYADDEGDVGKVMEHGDVFRCLPHQRISCH